MELNRFKQLLESTMGNVKPLIVEEDIKYRGIGQDETSEQKSNFKNKYYNYILTRINRELNEKYPSSSTLSTSYIEFTKPNVFTMTLKYVGSDFVIIFESPKKNIINNIKSILNQYGNLLNLSNDIGGGVQNWKEKTDGVKVFNVGYSFLSPTDPNSSIQYPEDKEKKFETFWGWWLDLTYKGIMEIVSKVYNLETEDKQPAVTTPTTTTATPGLSQQPAATETPQGG